MSQEIINKLVKYIDDRIHNNRDLSLTWYGGEFLLVIDVIEQI